MCSQRARTARSAKRRITHTNADPAKVKSKIDETYPLASASLGKNFADAISRSPFARNKQSSRCEIRNKNLRRNGTEWYARHRLILFRLRFRLAQICGCNRGNARRTNRGRIKQCVKYAGHTQTNRIIREDIALSNYLTRSVYVFVECAQRIGKGRVRASKF